MRRRAEHIFSLIERTVPMLIAIGAVLSVLLILQPHQTGLLAGAFAVWGLALAMTVADVIFSLIFKKKKEKKESDSQQDLFLSDVAHELKTPLTVIRGTAEALKDGAVSEEDREAFYSRILREADAMSRLVSDLLDVSRLRSGRISMELGDTNLDYLAHSVCDSLRGVGERVGVSVFCEVEEDLPIVWMDRDRIRQLMVIFLDNAVKHTPDGGRVILSVSREGNEVILSVSDTGSGIAEEDLPYVFERYYKADPQRGGLVTGSGIGLSIARQIVLLHGGTVEVTSKRGDGTCFTARLPLREFKENETV